MEPILPEPMAQPNYEKIPGAPVDVNMGATAENRPNISIDTAPEHVPAVKASQTQAPVSAPPAVQPNPIQQPVDDGIASSGGGPVIADDVDVIEKEWVDKAKQIVSATQGDPHSQEKEVSRLQADYLQKRYNKTIKPLE